jgi:NAD(P)-dependent dehydrogenase (short-subunit alcohol dehydrogenase family)
MNQAANKAALVTGAARGIGYATAKRFLAEGWRVALLDINAETLTRNHAALGKPDDTLAIHCDVSDAAGVARAIAAVAARFGRLDALVNNAGIAIFKPLLETTPEDWARTLAVNLTGPFLCTQAAELAALGIRVNAVAPGPVDTAMAKAVHTPAIRADYHNQIPLNRYGLEEELAEAIFFLCSERASYITGQVIAVDGGFESTGIGLKTLREEGRNG